MTKTIYLFALCALVWGSPVCFSPYVDKEPHEYMEPVSAEEKGVWSLREVSGIPGYRWYCINVSWFWPDQCKLVESKSWKKERESL